MAPKTATAAGLDRRRRVTDERPALAGRDEHRVDARALPLADVLLARKLELHAHEPAGGDVRQQLEEPIEVVLVVVALLGGEQRGLGVHGVGVAGAVEVADPDDGRLGGVADPVGRRAKRDSPGSPCRPNPGRRRSPGAPRLVHLDEDGAAVSLGDRLARPAVVLHVE